MEIIEIHSKGVYLANVLSNFSPNNFVMDGVQCASMEGFLQALKFRSAKKQINICALSGKAAKKAGKRKFFWKITGNVYWQGERYKRDSRQFDELLCRAYRQLSKNETFYNALKSTMGKRLSHFIGNHDKSKTILTEEEFIGYLITLRDGSSSLI